MTQMLVFAVFIVAIYGVALCILWCSAKQVGWQHGFKAGREWTQLARDERARDEARNVEQLRREAYALLRALLEFDASWNETIH